MARTRKLVETITCDICGKALKESAPTSIAFGGRRWDLDLCDKDRSLLNRQVAEWTSNARVTSRRTGRQAEEEWSYLESVGFKRHRGRKSAAERDALASR